MEDDDHDGGSLLIHSVCMDRDGLEDFLVLLRGTPPPTAQQGRGGEDGDGDDDAAAAGPGHAAEGGATTTYQPLLGALLQAPPEYT
jgi:hypothetical protein